MLIVQSKRIRGQRGSGGFGSHKVSMTSMLSDKRACPKILHLRLVAQSKHFVDFKPFRPLGPPGRAPTLLMGPLKHHISSLREGKLSDSPVNISIDEAL